MPSVYKMITTVMLQNGFKQSFHIGKEFLRNYQAYSSFRQRSEIWLGYAPIDDEMKMKRNNGQALSRLIPHMYQSFLVCEYTDHDGLGKESLTFLNDRCCHRR